MVQPQKITLKRRKDLIKHSIQKLDVRTDVYLDGTFIGYVMTKPRTGMRCSPGTAHIPTLVGWSAFNTEGQIIFSVPRAMRTRKAAVNRVVRNHNFENTLTE